MRNINWIFLLLLMYSCSKRPVATSSYGELDLDTTFARSGDTVGVTGKGLPTTSLHISIEGVEAKIVSFSSSLVRFLIPDKVSSGSVTLTPEGGLTLTATRRLQIVTSKRPVILSIYPTEAEPGDLVTLRASNFSTASNRNGVTFSGVPCRILRITDTTLQLVVPGGSVMSQVVLSAEGLGSSAAYPYATRPIDPLQPDGRIYYTAFDPTPNGFAGTNPDPLLSGYAGLFRSRDKNIIPVGEQISSLGADEAKYGKILAYNFCSDPQGDMYYTTATASTSFPQFIVRYNVLDQNRTTARTAIGGKINGPASITLSGYSSAFGDQVYFGTDSLASLPAPVVKSGIPRTDPGRRVLSYKRGSPSSENINYFLPEPSLVFAVSKTKLYYVTTNGLVKYADLAESQPPRQAADGVSIPGVTATGNFTVKNFSVTQFHLNTFLLTQPSRGDSILIFDRSPGAILESKITLFAPANAYHGQVMKTLYDAQNFPLIKQTIDAVQWVGDHIYFTFSPGDYTSVGRLNEDGSSATAKIVLTRLEPPGYARSFSLLFLNTGEK